MFNRRTAVLLVLGFLLFAYASPSTPAQNAGAQIIMNMESSSSVNSTNVTQFVQLEGNITVDKPPKVRVTVYLICTNDQGWSLTCSPDQFFFIDSDLRSFTCTARIPPKAATTAATIVVHALCEGYGPTGEAYANATITVTNSITTNSTLDAAPGPVWLDVAFGPVSGFAVWVLFLVAAPTISASMLTYFLWRRRKRKRASDSQQ